MRPALIPALALLCLGAVLPTAGHAAAPAPTFDIDYAYSLIDDTNHSTDPGDGRSWLVRYYHRLSGTAGDHAGDAQDICLINPLTGKNIAAEGGTLLQDCWWEMMAAWSAEAARQPGMSSANVSQHFYHLSEVDSNPYVSASSLSQDALTNPGPQNVVMLTIPGAVHPEQTVVIGDHPDAAQDSAFGSSYDDGQGAAVIMAVARAMLQHWISTGTWPARTVQFVLFDGEELGLFGSFFYQAVLMPPGSVDANDYAGMFNVDQNGLEYPARHFGTPDKPGQGAWYTNINETPLSDYSFYSDSSGKPYPRLVSNRPAISTFHQAVSATVSALFSELGARYAGRPMPLAGYRTSSVGAYPMDCVAGITCVDTFQDPADLQYILQQDDTLGRTDQDPFIRCGIPAFGILGAYDSDAQEPVNGMPAPLRGVPYAGYDTYADSVSWLNFGASGWPQPGTAVDQSPANEVDPGKLGAEALRRSLTFTGQLVTDVASRAEMAGSAPLPAQPVAYFVADRYSEHAGDADRFAAVPGPVPASSYSWAFDDGAIASGIAVSHSFESPGLHRVTLTASGAAGSSTYRASVNVVPAGSDANIPCGQVAGEAAAAPTYAVAGTAPRAAVHGTRAGLPNTSAAPYVPGMPLPLIAPVAVAAWRLRRLLARRGQPAAKA